MVDTEIRCLTDNSYNIEARRQINLMLPNISIRSINDMHNLPIIDRILRIGIEKIATGFDFNKNNFVGCHRHDIQFVTTLSPVPMTDIVSVCFEVGNGSIFACTPQLIVVGHLVK